MCQWTGSSLVNMVACHLFIARPLPEILLTLSWTLSIITSKVYLWRKCIEKCRLQKWWPFCSGLCVLNSMPWQSYDAAVMMIDGRLFSWISLMHCILLFVCVKMNPNNRALSVVANIRLDDQKTQIMELGTVSVMLMSSIKYTSFNVWAIYVVKNFNEHFLISTHKISCPYITRHNSYTTVIF